MTALEALGLKWLTLAAGFFGAVVSLSFIDGLTPFKRCVTVIAGTLVAAYCTPVAMEMLGLSHKIEGGIAFLGGLFGMSIAGASLKAIPEWVEAAKQKWLGGGRG